jgi:hypothetical protein
MKVIDESNIISDSDKGSNGSNYKHKEMEKMLMLSDKEEEFIEPEELLQLQQDLKVLDLDMI